MNKIVIRGELPSLNEVIDTNRYNRYAGASQKKKATALCAQYIRLAVNKGFTIDKDKLPVDFKLTWYAKNRRKDKDNISSAIKFIFDGLVEVGLLKNDGWKQIGNIEHQFEVDKENPRVEVEILDS